MIADFTQDLSARRRLLVVVPVTAILRATRLVESLAQRAEWHYRVAMVARHAVVIALALAACGISSQVSRQLGARCDENRECEDRCVVGTDFPGGLCTVSCADDNECPDGSQCVDLEGGVCLYSCTPGEFCSFLGDTWECRGAPARSGLEEVMVCAGAQN